MKTSQEFFDEIELSYKSAQGRLVSSGKVHKFVHDSDTAFLNSNFYNLKHKVVFYVEGKMYLREKSVFSMVHNRDEARAIGHFLL